MRLIRETGPAGVSNAAGESAVLFTASEPYIACKIDNKSIVINDTFVSLYFNCVAECAE